MIIRRILVAVFLVATLSACGGSSDTSTEDTDALARQLVDTYAQAVFDRDQQALGDLLSEAYVLRRSDGSGYDRQGYIDALAEGSNYELVDFEVTDVTAKRDGDILVVLFTLSAEILEDGRSVLSEPSPSLVTFVKVGDEWKLAADAFFSR